MLCVRIGFKNRWTILRTNLELVETAGGEFGNEEFPDAGVAEPLHLVVFAGPVVEVTDDADAACVWRPDGERDAFGAAHFRDVRTELVIDLFVTALAEEMQINFTKSNHGLHRLENR